MTTSSMPVSGLMGVPGAVEGRGGVGVGVGYEGLHGTDERIRLDTVPVVQAAYHQVLLTLLHAA